MRLLFLFFCFITFVGNAQTLLQKEKWVAVYGQKVGNEVIVPSSIEILSGQEYEVGLSHGSFFFLDVRGDTVTGDEIIHIRYRCIELEDEQITQRRSQEIYRAGGYGFEQRNESFVIEVEEKQKKKELFYAPNIEKTGSLTRGLSMGNSQDVFVNSAMNLQLQGNITEDVRLTATLTDQDVPFQPEGNTQQIQDFDRVLIEIAHKNAVLTAGDIVMRNRESTFLKYNKNAQGAQARVMVGNDSSRVKSLTTGGVSIAKGQFYSANITPIDGVLGPYRLTGPNNESNIVVIAGSEKVYIDGVLLERGFDADYVIDYNLAEVTFNEKILITQYTRIRIDYEYAVQYYSRTIVEASQQFSTKKWEAGFQVYQEKDDRNSSLFYSLSDVDKMVLASIGDSLQYAYAPAIDSVANFDENRVLYTIIDTLTDNGIPAQCLKRAGSNDSPLYSAGFSQVGNQRGDYVLKEITPFGRVYEWVSPINGQSQGDYLPVRQLQAPNQKQMISAHGTYKFNQHESIRLEGAFSNQDQNLFSDINNENNQGHALSLKFTSKDRPINSDWKLLFDTELMYINEDFLPIDRFRNIEFDRNWTLPYDSLPQTEEKFIQSQIAFEDTTGKSFAYQIAIRDKEQSIQGQQHQTDIKYHIRNWHLNVNAFIMNADLLASKEHSQWQRLRAETFYKFNEIIPGYIYHVDQQQTTLTETDSITNSWMNFTEHKAYLKKGDSLQWNYQLDYSYREDQTPINGQLMPRTKMDTYQLTIGKKGKKGGINTNIIYRKWTDYLGTTPQNEESLQGRINGNLILGKGVGKISGTYTISSSRELQREFVYVRVADGRGTHTWRDLNGDGIKDLNEFFLAQNPDERQYARFYTPTNEYIPAFRSSINVRANLNAPRQWKKRSGLPHFISRFSNTSSFLIDKKSTSEDIQGRYLPILSSTSEDDLLAYKYALRNTLFFNRSNPIYGADFRIILLENQQLLTQGRENRSDNRYSVSGRLNLGRKFTLKTEVTQRNILSGSEYLDDRNYTILEQGITPSLSYQPNIFTRFSTSYTYTQKLGELFTQSENNQENGNFHEVSLETKWSKANLFTITTKASTIIQEYQGDTNTAIAYEMLNALSTGTNFRWNVAWTQTLFDGLQLRVQYDGRKSENTNVNHIGTVNLTALF
ncbi:hypothetical protein KMW28_13700 [Flammeovirga yaeyamensis]|uniref:Uncharacterized protein n=1 Tax=Flammeovirga yaeyamensis TaxID=367791 RepID=A0AAX1MZL4_9BACT|nr:hypothetical protein [Flammeovirga yaeyamensis]MBB3700950.1 hypothetical protein [Flammeovirga yaeyamensis]NMF38056.1 hypothetical protein [Flammeovirga yaeyamensis]QWG00706.1 hypothetical protein KMW28_13700 [Flammeovirga yaeyamensis]